ncbi:uncharacterized protein OCT59_006516 [Rhizophagus irregularis]|uniref:Uncharacterized protein n=1 Tax=Rhizophagus irregularis (strain DAOM 181602 / DAOM 197198 / MUCL 43194) TaxID=747089 RepID=U9TQM1_RHIID|nr:hypothetical protein GLOIN_2v1877371 [Rhizophagus irregularis DAOM 181602=DAOM 197198]POG69622.1 hypothetical protein GLOIN_2v1877371 [Rhizophagus irregularis DAOM 181602=DAOM 197198]UZO15080.1 hypothetical protein OCT59_006516 [Rhizophagus irregularis]GBC20162.1 hypothetical protein GLOIN_2v1877371 [Rhizophagus irregularis DAOM 181602=DAOM 197198]CAG8452654.1 9728_t:CDS:2 [Rhizophagus irregularis]|eukprot:XP_025176488.1 hypothetical protein GLOIN_2v1877371 [Rhizophagus irregularis DAOM 181602=DAOM 197198]
MKKGTIFVSLLLLLLSIVRAQDGAPTAGTPTPTASPAPNGIETCLEISQCGDDQACRAKCAGVPNPTEQQVNDTIACIGKCNPADPNYAACRDSCIDTYYNPKPTFTSSTIPPSTIPPSTIPPSTIPPSVSTASTSAASSNKASPTPISSVAVKTTSFSTLLLTFIIFMTSVCFSLDK